jgi:hypothetical protein
MKKFAQGNEELLFVKKESIEGEFEYPAAANALLAIGAATSNQDDEFIPDAQVRNRRSHMSPIKGRTNPGTWGLSTYTKPSGVLNTPPEADVLFECAMGKKSVNGGVVYALDSSINYPSFSLLRKVGHTCFFMAGATVNDLTMKVSGAEIGQETWGGQFMHWYLAGESVLTTAAITSDTHIHVDDPLRYSDSVIKIVVGADDNSGDGYLVTDVNYATGQIDITPNIVTGALLGAAVKPWYPSTQTEVGTPVHGKYGAVTIDGKTAIILEATITLGNGIKYYTDIKDGKMYPSIYGAPGFREVSGTLRLYFFKNMPNYFYRSSNQVQNNLIVPCGNVSGRIMEINCPRIEYKTPAISGEEDVMVDLAFQAVSSSAGDDELAVTFK